MPRDTADRNLLFGILAVQMDFITRDHLITAMHAWVLQKSTALGQILLAQKALTSDTHALLEALVTKHLAMHGNDAEKSLAAVNAASSVKNDLESIADDGVQASLAFLPNPAERGGDPFATVAPTVDAPTSAPCRFHILRHHAKGGLGVVFVAQDQELHREVALKEIQDRHADHPESRARFLLEAEITGGLEHPGIVPVYGLGTYADGRPYYAMRFIRGDSLADAIKRYHQGQPSRGSGRVESERTLELRKLLGRFIDVCEAIQYAHDRGVLHRDLKPGNIMLGKYGETLVVDWGLAKATAKPSEPAAQAREMNEPALRPSNMSGTAETIAGTSVGTPQFMSPEQAAGRLDQLGPTSDVYSLGATLYALLTGKPPFGDKEIATVLTKVQRGDFPPPHQIRADVHPALEAICMKAMALKPMDRYASTHAMADDLEHWLADEPVSAWPEPWRVKTRRWMSRHRVLVTATAAALLVGLLATTMGAIWHEQEKAHHAMADALRKEAIRTALDLAQKSRAEIQEDLRAPGGVFDLLNEPTRWQAHIQVSQASLDQAKALLTLAGDAVEPELTQNWQAQESALAHDEAERNLAMRLEKIRLDQASLKEGKFDSSTAVRAYPKAFAEAGFPVLTESAGAVANRIRTSAIKEQLVAALDDWAMLVGRAGDKDRLGRLLQMARLATPDPVWGDPLRQADVWSNPELLAKLVKDAPQAKFSRQMLTCVGMLLAKKPREQESWLRKAQALHPGDFWLNLTLGAAISKAKPVEAEGFYRAALAVRPSSAGAYNNLGNALRGQQRWGDAIAAFQKALDLESRFALAYNNLGATLLDQDRSEEAIAAFRKAIEIDPKYADAWTNLGKTLLHQKRLDEAAAAYRKAIDLEPKTARAYNDLGIVLNDQQRTKEAIAMYEQAIQLDPEGALPYNNLGSALLGQKRLNEAIAAFRKAIALDPNYGIAQDNLGLALFQKGDFADARAATNTAMDLLKSNLPLWLRAAKRVADCRRLEMLEERLPLVLKDEATATPAELLDLAELCLVYKKRYATAVRFYQAAFKLKPMLAQKHQYKAAGAAALAAAGQGDEAAKLSVEESRKMRLQARVWLRADLSFEAKGIKTGQAVAVIAAIDRLSAMQLDANLAAIRDPKDLSKLPEEGRLDWQSFWKDLQQTLKDARGRFTETRLQGSLTAQERSRIHEFHMSAGKTYVLDMESSAFDSLLRLQNAQSKWLAENDDIGPANRNARILYVPIADGAYRLVATSYEQAGVGAYTLIVREFAGK